MQPEVSMIISMLIDLDVDEDVNVESILILQAPEDVRRGDDGITFYHTL